MLAMVRKSKEASLECKREKESEVNEVRGTQGPDHKKPYAHPPPLFNPPGNSPNLSYLFWSLNTERFQP